MPHHCHATACAARVPPEMWGCRKHWFMVPKAIRDRIWKTYRVGQCDDMQPSKKYLEAAREAVVAVAEKEGIEPDTLLYDRLLDRFRKNPHDFEQKRGGLGTKQLTLMNILEAENHLLNAPIPEFVDHPGPDVDLDFLEKHGNEHTRARVQELKAIKRRTR